MAQTQGQIHGGTRVDTVAVSGGSGMDQGPIV